MQERWSLSQFSQYQESGMTPEQVEKSKAKAEKSLRMSEKALQDLCERWLSLRGYRRLTAQNATLSHGIGWFGHLFAAKRNPLMPDLFIFNTDMSRCLMIELKVANRYQPGQKEMIASGAWTEAWSFEDVEAAVKEWEDEIA